MPRSLQGCKGAPICNLERPESAYQRKPVDYKEIARENAVKRIQEKHVPIMC